MKLKVTDLNLWQGRLLESAVDFLKQENPDIILLQEVFDGHTSDNDALNSFSVLKAKLGDYKFQAFTPAFFVVVDGVEIPQGQAVLSKFPIIESKSVFYDVPYGSMELDVADLKEEVHVNKSDGSMIPRNLQHAVIQAGDKTLNVFNTQGVWGYNGLDSPRRIAMGKVIADNVAGKSNVILSGDFNMDPDTQAMAQVEKHLTSVFKYTLPTTFNMKRKTNPGYAEAAVDMFFVSPEIKILNQACKQVDVSDHLPLVVELEV